jgi:hypothetical protein
LATATATTKTRQTTAAIRSVAAQIMAIWNGSVQATVARGEFFKTCVGANSCLGTNFASRRPFFCRHKKTV